ncbi:MAG: tetratricopeptide repeat protein [Myxococcota bacterium]
MIFFVVASPGTQARWLFGPIPDLLLGCGGLYACVLVAFAIGGEDLRRVGVEAVWFIPLLVLLLGTPHYGATLLRVYEHRSDRRAYVIFSVWATIAIAAVFGVSLYSWVLATWIVTVYLTWSPWHYAGQNYGLALLFLRRRGVEITPAAKRLFYGSFLLSYALTFLLFHGDTGCSPSPEFAASPRTMFVAIGIPAPVMAVAFPLLLVAYGATLVGAGTLLLRHGSLRDLAPAAALVVSQALWFAVPALIRHWRVPVDIEPFRWELRSYYFPWIALAGHCCQYIWVTTYYERQTAHWRGYTRYFGKILAAGMAVWTLPALLLDPNRVGDLPNTAALALLVAAAVNIHHFVLDGAIWKLRHSRVAHVLIRLVETPDDAARSPDPVGGQWPRRAVWSLAAVGCALAIFLYTQKDLLFPRAVKNNDLVAARAILERIDWLNQVSDDAWKNLASAEAGVAGTSAGYGRSPGRPAGLSSSAAAAFQRAREHARGGDWQSAAAAYEEALTLDPEHPRLLRGAARAWLALGDPDRAIPILEKLVAQRPRDGAARRSLDRARRLAAGKKAP